MLKFEGNIFFEKKHSKNYEMSVKGMILIKSDLYFIQKWKKQLCWNILKFEKNIFFRKKKPNFEKWFCKDWSPTLGPQIKTGKLIRFSKNLIFNYLVKRPSLMKIMGRAKRQIDCTIAKDFFMIVHC